MALLKIVTLGEFRLTIRTVMMPVRMGRGLAAQTFGLGEAVEVSMTRLIAMWTFPATSLRAD